MKVVKDLFVEKKNQRQGNLHDWKKERTKYVQVDKEMQMKLSYPKIWNRGRYQGRETVKTTWFLESQEILFPVAMKLQEI